MGTAFRAAARITIEQYYSSQLVWTMANTARIPAFKLDASADPEADSRISTPHPGKTSPVPSKSFDHEEIVTPARSRKVEGIDANYSGPRKLIRPSLPDNARMPRGQRRHTEVPLLAHQELSTLQNATAEGSHAEAFYFQKQMQGQTQIVFVLDNGEKIEGYIEWYDRNAIKIRHANRRVLIYKSSIKYLYKVSDTAGAMET